jgi:hypothetical protein
LIVLVYNEAWIFNYHVTLNSFARALNQLHDIASQLTSGDWLMFESSEPNVQPFWIGKANQKQNGMTNAGTRMDSDD